MQETHGQYVQQLQGLVMHTKKAMWEKKHSYLTLIIILRFYETRSKNVLKLVKVLLNNIP